ncbi:MAG: histidine--tRNA ligase [Phycisphaerales bacterium]
MPFQAPKGTRDFYPTDWLRRRYIIDTWRRVSLRHGFEEIDGPTFEDSALYTVKSGEGILNELFGAYSGKDPNDTKQVQSGGPPPFALRPEFTPTLARMYAARAKQLPQPTKWFCVSNFFRAERPQRGRLREFWQWNVDVLGELGSSEGAHCLNSEAMTLCTVCLLDLGLMEQAAHLRVNVSGGTESLLDVHEMMNPEVRKAAINHLDRFSKIDRQKWREQAIEIGFPLDFIALLTTVNSLPVTDPAISSLRGYPEYERIQTSLRELEDALVEECPPIGFCYDPTIVRGLAYYTGTVFELIAEGERAVAGGGRYDKLIELFGGPPTPAVGFGMGDVVLTNLLDDRKLMPEGRDLLEATSRPLPVRPDVFVIANENEGSQAKLVPTVASLRRGVETEKYKQGECKPWSIERYSPVLGGVPPLHARRSYKSTKNIGKLLSDATACHARFALIIEDGEKATLKNMDTGEQTKDVVLEKVGAMVAAG